MSEYQTSELSKIKRGPKRANYDVATVHDILDSHFICHVAYCHHGTAIAIPTGYGRKAETIYLHGALKNRMLMSALDQEKVSLTVTHLDGYVLARSVFHHSFNYRSAVVFGKPRLVKDDAEKMEALEIITENILKGRWSEARIPNEKELKITAVIAVDIEEASAKIRTGGPNDEEEDYALGYWAGVVPLHMQVGAPVADERLEKNIEVPASVLSIAR